MKKARLLFFSLSLTGMFWLVSYSLLGQEQVIEETPDTCNDCQYYTKDVFCIRVKYENGNFEGYVGNRLKCTSGTGTCHSTNCSN
jgi:hypothetical protein